MKKAALLFVILVCVGNQVFAMDSAATDSSDQREAELEVSINQTVASGMQRVSDENRKKLSEHIAFLERRKNWKPHFYNTSTFNSYTLYRDQTISEIGSHTVGLCTILEKYGIPCPDEVTSDFVSACKGALRQSCQD